MRTLIIVPAYNEEKNIQGVIEDIRTNLPGADIIVIDDGSKDSTSKKAQEAGAKVISLPLNLGIGAAVQTGCKYAFEKGYEIAVQFDGDGQHMAEELPGLIKPIKEGRTDAVIGSRFLSGDPYEMKWQRAMGIRVLSRLVSLIAGQRITDPTSGFRAANRKAIEFYCKNYPEDYPEAEAVVLLRRAGMRLEEVPARMRQRLGGISSITPLRGLYYMVKVTLAIVVDLMKKK